MEQCQRRKKTAAERRQQRVRAEGRRLQHAIGAMHAVHSHRGGQLTSLGNALLQALQQMGEAPTSDGNAPTGRGTGCPVPPPVMQSSSPDAPMGQVAGLPAPSPEVPSGELYDIYQSIQDRIPTRDGTDRKQHLSPSVRILPRPPPPLAPSATQSTSTTPQPPTASAATSTQLHPARVAAPGKQYTILI
jgi:hypothetical protein